MRTRSFLLATLLTLLVNPVILAQEGEGLCPAGLPERPALSQHIEHSAIVDGSLSFNEVFAHGEELFTALFNACDGRGRPAATGGLANRQMDQDAFHRISGPDNNSCVGCHIQPHTGGSGEFALNVFVLAELADPVLESTFTMLSNFRNPPELFGVGPIEMLAREMSTELWALRDDAVDSARTRQTAVTIDLVTKGGAFRRAGGQTQRVAGHERSGGGRP